MNPDIQQWMDARYLTAEVLGKVNALIGEDSVKFPVWGPSGQWAFDVVRNFNGDVRYMVTPSESRPSHTLYLYKAQIPHIKRLEYVVVVEGVTDALALTRLGIPAVGLLGSAMSRVQQALLSHISPIVLVWPDGDEAGDLLRDAVADLPYYCMQVEDMDPAEVVGRGPIPKDIMDVLRYPGEHRYIRFSPDGGILAEELS